MKILVFKIWWKFAHFRRFYTTTSPLTFSIIPFTTLRWILAGILWKEKDSYNEQFARIKLWQSLCFDASKKKMFGLNLINTKTWGWYIQVKQEILINPCYTIYVSDENFDEYEKLKNYLEKWYREYTPYLGIAQFIANIEYLGEFVGEKVNLENVEVDSIVPIEKLSDGKNLIIKDWQFFEIEKVPFTMDNERNLTSLREFAFDINGWKLKLKEFDWHKVGNKLVYLV